MNSVNYWETAEHSGQNFLSNLRNKSFAREKCRKIIASLIETGEAQSITEVGIGGLNERIALDELLTKHPKVKFTGLDWTQAFVENAKEQFPEDHFYRYDIVKGEGKAELADIVYSQHVLEHCPGLNPALTHMLALTKKVLLNIFFIPPKNAPEFIHFDQYPLYHNTYDRRHIEKVCAHQGFECFFTDMDNSDIPEAPEKKETILMAYRKGSMRDGPL